MPDEIRPVYNASVLQTAGLPKNITVKEYDSAGVWEWDERLRRRTLYPWNRVQLLWIDLDVKSIPSDFYRFGD